MATLSQNKSVVDNQKALTKDEKYQARDDKKSIIINTYLLEAKKPTRSGKKGGKYRGGM